MSGGAASVSGNGQNDMVLDPAPSRFADLLTAPSGASVAESSAQEEAADQSMFLLPSAPFGPLRMPVHDPTTLATLPATTDTEGSEQGAEPTQETHSYDYPFSVSSESEATNSNSSDASTREPSQSEEEETSVDDSHSETSEIEDTSGVEVYGEQKRKGLDKTGSTAALQPPRAPDKPLQYSPFGLAGLATSFPLGGPEAARNEASLLTRSEAVKHLKHLGLAAHDSTADGLHYTKTGEAVFVHREDAFRIRKLSPECMKALKKQGQKHVRRFIEAAARAEASQEIANLSGLAASARELQKCGVLACLETPSLARRLNLLAQSCEEWAHARSTVARLMHQAKSRQTQIKSLEQELATLRDVLLKDNEAVHEASARERKTAQKKRGIIQAFTRELQPDMKRLQQLLHAAQATSK